MWKRVALLGSIAALIVANPSSSFAGIWATFAAAAAVATAGLPGPGPFEPVQYYYPRPYRPYFWRPYRGYYPRPSLSYYLPRPYYRPLFFYGDSFAPYGYNWYAGYGYDGF
jgi:hypothetical protein